ncbi:MAG TPA: pseudouridine synthase [Rhodocyclaceae bacterium]|nr:pseudouridine synthase [Rhodocyclaceae bacterium]
MSDTEKPKKLTLPEKAAPEKRVPGTPRRSPVRASGVVKPRISTAEAKAEEAKRRPPRPEASPVSEKKPRSRPTTPNRDEAPRRDARAADEGAPRSRRPASTREASPTFNPDLRPAAPRNYNDTAPARAHERRTRGADGIDTQQAERPRRKPPAKPAEPQFKDADGSVRLSKRMAELGLCSRREADDYIERGWVKVDGVVIDELGSKIMPDQTIELTPIAETTQTQRVTILLHKPVGYVSGQAEDGYEPASVLITPENHWEEDPIKRRVEARHLRKLAPAGRLDIDSTGLLVLTQDGRIAKQLIGEKSDVEKEYLVRVEGPLSFDDLKLLNHGLMLDGVALQPAKVSWQNEDQLRFALREGRKRQIRRMCELVGLHVVGLKRVRIGQVKLAKLPPGKWRYLGDHEKF